MSLALCLQVQYKVLVNKLSTIIKVNMSFLYGSLRDEIDVEYYKVHAYTPSLAFVALQ